MTLGLVTAEFVITKPNRVGTIYFSEQICYLNQSRPRI